MAAFLLALSLHLYTIIMVATVAPGDEDPLCQQLRALGGAPIPAYSANMRVLMDSWNYHNLLPTRTGAVWDQVDNDENNRPGLTTNWVQQTNTACEQYAQVCGFSAGPQNNWLITQLINRTVNGTRLPQVSVLIEFELQGCDTTLNCQQAFNTHVYETSTKNTTAARNINNYQQVQRVSTAVNTGDKVNETITIYFNTSHSSFYFVIQDETSCIVVTRLIVSYHICPKRAVNLISYPETIAPILEESVIVSPSCVTNAEPVSWLAPQELVCTTGGVWSHVPPGATCRCIGGHFPTTDTCRPCPAGTYLSPSNNSCSTCPAKSVSEEEGLTQCTCMERYYRAPQGEEDLPCDLPPSPPRNLMIVDRTETSITVGWDPPMQQPMRSISCNLTYGVYTSVSGDPRVKVHHIIDETVTVIPNLLPGKSYTVYISSENCITDQLSENQSAMITASIEASTLKAKTVPLAAITVPSIFVVTPIIIAVLTAVILITVTWWKKVKTTTKQEVYYSEVGPPSIPVKINEDTFYEDMSTLDKHQKREYAHFMTKTSLQKSVSDINEATGDSNPALGQNPAYGINTVAMAPGIDTEKNRAYGYL